MTPEEFLKGLAPTAEQDQGLAGCRTMASMFSTFYLGLLADGVAGTDAVDMTCELIRCTVGDHKPLA